MHKITYTVTNYPGSAFASKIAYKCACGKTGAITDGRNAPTMKLARAAAKRHAERVTA